MLNIKALEVLEGRGGRKVKVFESIGSYVESSIAAYEKGDDVLLNLRLYHSLSIAILLLHVAMYNTVKSSKCEKNESHKVGWNIESEPPQTEQGNN
jgi:hypothetical protein